MNDVVAKYYMEKVQLLEWTDVVGGLVRVVRKSVPVSPNKSMMQSFPVACDITSEDCEGSPDILKMYTPDDSKTSVIYFEDKGTSTTSIDGKTKMLSKLRLVCWMNLQRFENAGCSLSFYAISSILPILRMPNAVSYDGIIQAMMTISYSFPPKDANIFARYSYNELKQYLLYPYDYFAIDIETVFDVNSTCVPELQVKDDECS